ncbi:DUF1206 domain-containing protein [Cyclobacterium marinum]|uniref:DUF1206 domain-containing protein n=1 Tax=Cyclobacterium marinum (strain ATCC 25205 / DSM 745 / LMG 13164 / NCIMB 1802) TaxID=880070 RepID=G0J4R6_CYCMS|nr:DUF1206 domain-containing protein [Cyclobacterium marinum]AEL25296.1 protein of unknown function DUF1206 [Cyclobacterium marinum DSM 745]
MEKSDLNPSKQKKKKIARLGIGTKGVVYLLIGGLTAWEAFGKGGKKTGSNGALAFVIDQPFGQILLWLVVLGLAGYVFWRMYQTFKDTEEKGNDFKGIIFRLGYFSSGIFYLFIIYNALQLLLGGGGDNGGGKESMIQQLLAQEYGRWIVASIALIFLIRALIQIFIAFSGKFKEKVKESGMNDKAQQIMISSGRVGYTSRGIVVGVIAYLTVRAAITYDASKSGGTKEAFNFIQNEFGAVVLGVIALGMLAFGLFLIFKASEHKMDF